MSVGEEKKKGGLTYYLEAREYLMSVEKEKREINLSKLYKLGDTRAQGSGNLCKSVAKSSWVSVTALSSRLGGAIKMLRRFYLMHTSSNPIIFEAIFRHQRDI